MLFRNKAGLSVLTVVVGAAAVAPAVADTGFYVGLTAGQSRFHQTKGDGDAMAVAAWDSGPDSFTYNIASSSINKNDIAFSAVVGYRFMPALSFEASYTDLGESKYRSAGTLNFNPYPFTTRGKVPRVISANVASIPASHSCIRKLRTDIIECREATCATGP